MVRTFDDGFYSLARWRRLRAWFLARNPLCSDPWGFHQKDGVIVPAGDVDHILDRRRHPELAFDPRNLQALCHSCHSRKTAGRSHG